jgi:DNA-binding CsgD family transcriptional regulator
MSSPGRHLHLHKPPSEHQRAGREAAARGAWKEAREAFEAAIGEEETPEALEGLGATLGWLEDVPGAVKAREGAFRLYTERGDKRGAARMATALAVEFAANRGEFPVADGWFQRAARLLGDLEPGPEHAWLKVWEASVRMHFQGDTARGRVLAVEGAALARSLRLPEAEILSVGLEGLRLVDEGRIADGVKLLDEAATAAVTGEMKDLDAGGNACCYVLTTCERLRDYGRALQWLERVVARYRDIGVSRFLVYCRSHYVGVFTWRGEWQRAQAEIDAVYRESGDTLTAAVVDMNVREAELRRIQGRWEEAAELLRRAETHPRANLGWAALALDQADSLRAVDYAHRYFRSLAADDRLPRAAGEVVLAHAHAARGELDAAREAVERLRPVAEAAGTEAMLGELRACEGAVALAAGDADGARKHFEDAVDLFARGRNPYEGARCRLDLGAALAALERRDAALTEVRAAADVLRRLGARAAVERADRLRVRLEGEAPPRAAGPEGLSPRQVDVLRLVARGLSNRDIGEKLFVSEFTVKRHVADILSKLDLPSRAAAAAWAAERRLV